MKGLLPKKSFNILFFTHIQARQSSFGRHPASTKFKEWLTHYTTALNVSMTSKTWDFLSYLAYETVGQIVDLSFIVRRDNCLLTTSTVKDQLQRNIVHSSRQLPLQTSSMQVIIILKTSTNNYNLMELIC